jgi:hypothetical protein
MLLRSLLLLSQQDAKELLEELLRAGLLRARECCATEAPPSALAACFGWVGEAQQRRHYFAMPGRCLETERAMPPRVKEESVA